MASVHDPVALQEEIKALKQQLAQAQKLTALGELLGTTTHEFNNALMAIINHAKMGLRHRDEATRDRALERILSAGQRAAKITNSVLGMARNRSDRFEPTDIRQLIEESLFLLEREMRKYRIHVEAMLDPVPLVRCNGNQIQQILLNLLVNARQAIGERGQIQVRLLHDPGEATVDLSVQDSGRGIRSEDLPKIFEPFYSTKRGPDASGKGGTGLGLSACRDIVELHRGRIRVASTVGKGTCFTIKLPLTTEPKPPATAGPPQDSPAS